MRFCKYISAFALTAFLSLSCLKNDLSLPRVLAQFMELEVEGGLSSIINPEERTVALVVDESVELSSLKVSKCVLNENAFFKDGTFPEVIDLSSPMEVMLSMWQDYDWTITASQPVERYALCTNQIGDAVVNVDDRTVYVYISESQRLKYLEIKSLKLERLGSEVVSTKGVELLDPATGETETVERDCEFPMILDCNSARTFDVLFQGETTTWTFVAIPVEVAAEIRGVDARCYYADVLVVFSGGEELPVVEYRNAGSEEWISLPREALAVDGINITAHISGLLPDTEYVVRTIADGEVLPEQNFRTCLPTQLYNMSFDDWWLDDPVWLPYLEGMGGGSGVWDSANIGAAKYIGSTTTPTDDIVDLDYEDEDVDRKAVRMVSKDAVLAFAAGNLYTGVFGKTQGVGAILDWGVEFTSKPMGLKGYYKYFPKPIDVVKSPYESMKGKMDNCQIQIFITDWDSPFKINTTAKEFVDIENDEHIIAYGKLESSEEVSEYKEFYIPLEYRDRTRTPRYIVISCCASYLGDYFTGGKESTLFVDEFSLVYDTQEAQEEESGEDLSE